MRLKYYKISLRQMGIKKPFVLFLFLFIIFLILFCIISYVKRVSPIIKDMCESNANAVSVKIVNNSVYDYISDKEYSDFVNIEKDNSGNIKSISANTKSINKMTNEISNNLIKLMEENEESYIRVPIGSFSGTNFFAGIGPKIKVKSMPSGTVDVKLLSEFSSVGINQTKHTLSLDITISMRIIAPFFTDALTYNSKVIIAETVIVGDIPELYYDNLLNNNK